MSLLKFENDLYSFGEYVNKTLLEHNKNRSSYYFATTLIDCIENGYFSERKIEEEFSRQYDVDFDSLFFNVLIRICDSKWRINSFTYCPELAQKIITTCISSLNNEGYFKAIEDDYREDNVLDIELSFSSEATDLETDQIGFSGLVYEFDQDAFNTLCTAPNVQHVRVYTKFEGGKCLLLDNTNNNFRLLDKHEIPKLIKGYEIQNVLDTVKSYFPSHFANEQILMPRGF